jgi:cobalt-zinc-cadmium resistance protein CzcA
VIVGGMMLAPIVILVTRPALIEMFSRRTVPNAGGETVPEPVHWPARL